MRMKQGRNVGRCSLVLFFQNLNHLFTVIVLFVLYVNVKGSGGSMKASKSVESKTLEFLDLEDLKPSALLEKIGIKAEIINKDELPHDKTFFGEDSNGYPIVVGTWFQYGSYTLAVAMFGTAFLVACAATAIYYVLFVVTEPSQSKFTRSLKQSSDFNLSISSWDTSRILQVLTLAYDTFENRGKLLEPDCQMRLLCEMNETQYFSDASLFRRMTNSLFNMDSLINWISLPYVKDLQKAYKTGLDSEESCSNIYLNCIFTMNSTFQ